MKSRNLENQSLSQDVKDDQVSQVIPMNGLLPEQVIYHEEIFKQSLIFDEISLG